MALSDPPPAEKSQTSSVLQTMSRFASVGILVALVYVGWTLYSRHASEEQAVHDVAARQEEARQKQAKLIFGSGEVKIVSYSVDKPTLAPGEKANLCYGVINASKVTLDPPVEPVKPSAYHCLTVAPRATTVYTLTAAGDRGEPKSLSVTVRVH